MNKIAKFVFQGLLFLDAVALIYIALSFPMNLGEKARFALFALQHLYTFFLFLHRIFQNNNNPNQNAVYLFYLTIGNFAQFAVLEIYLATQPEASIFLINDSIHEEEIVIQIYLHLYYQINIYFGVFSVLSVLIMIFYKIQQLNQTQRIEQVVEILQKQQYEATGEEEPCSICLSCFQIREQLYKLRCGHIFHQECLKNWLQQKLNCPLCRDTDLAIVQ